MNVGDSSVSADLDTREVSVESDNPVSEPHLHPLRVQPGLTWETKIGFKWVRTRLTDNLLGLTARKQRKLRPGVGNDV